MKKLLYRYSILGIPFGALGFLFESGWLRYPIFFIGAALCGVGWILGLEKEALRTVEKSKSKAALQITEIKPKGSLKNISIRDWVHHLSILGLVIGLFGFAFEAGWVRYLFFIVGGTSCVLVWYFDGDEDK